MEIFKHWLQKVSSRKFWLGSFDLEFRVGILSQNSESKFWLEVKTFDSGQKIWLADE